MLNTNTIKYKKSLEDLMNKFEKWMVKRPGLLKGKFSLSHKKVEENN